MKKIIAILVITCLCFCLMLGCEDKKDKSTVNSKPSATTPQNNNNKPNQNNNNSQINQNNGNNQSNQNDNNSQTNQNNSNNQNNNNSNNSNQNNNNQNTPSTNSNSNKQNADNIVKIINNTGTDIYGLYAVTSNNGSWGDNILGNEILSTGYTFDIQVPVGNPHWDFMVADYEGTTVTWSDLDLTSISQIDLYVDKSTGQIMADWK